jgi:hypothetical protein
MMSASSESKRFDLQNVGESLSFYNPKDSGCTFPRNVGKFLP